MARRSAKNRVNICGMCGTTITGARKSAGSCDRMSASAAGPPVDRLIATTSAVIVGAERTQREGRAPGARRDWSDAGRGDPPDNRHSDLILGTRSSRIRCCAASRAGRARPAW